MKNSARTSQRNSESSCTTAEDSPSPKIQTTLTLLVSSRVAPRDMDSTSRPLTSFGIKTDLCLKRSRSSNIGRMLLIRSQQRRRKPTRDD